jgi:hypothetical protein
VATGIRIKKAWYLSCRKVLELGLGARIIDEVLKFKFIYMPTIYLHIEIKYPGLPVIGRYANVVK